MRFIVMLLMVSLPYWASAQTTPPVVTDDAYTTDWDTPLTVPAPGLLHNDYDPDGDTLETHLRQGPARGTLTLNRDGSFTYRPEPLFAGQDSFIYKAYDGRHQVDGTVTLTITPGNLPPNVQDDAYTITPGTRFHLPSPGVLANDSDPEGDALTTYLISPPAAGHLGFHADGSLWFDDLGEIPPCGHTTFDHKAVDSKGHRAEGTVTLTLAGSGGSGGSGNPPIFTSTPLTQISLYEPYRYTPTLSGEVASLTLDQGPAGMHLNDAQQLIWVPDTGQQGSYTVILSAQNPCGASAHQSYQLVVESTAVNQPRASPQNPAPPTSSSPPLATPNPCSSRIGKSSTSPCEAGTPLAAGSYPQTAPA